MTHKKFPLSITEPNKKKLTLRRHHKEHLVKNKTYKGWRRQDWSTYINALKKPTVTRTKSERYFTTAWRRSIRRLPSLREASNIWQFQKRLAWFFEDNPLYYGILTMLYWELPHQRSSLSKKKKKSNWDFLHCTDQKDLETSMQTRFMKCSLHPLTLYLP